MTEQEALSVLGLPSTATRLDIERRYKALARRYHPDTQHDETVKLRLEVKMARLNEAKEVLLKRQHQHGIVPTTPRGAVMRPESRLAAFEREERERREYREAAQRLAGQIIVRQTTRAQQAKHRAARFATLSAGLAILSSRVLPITDRVFPESFVLPVASIILTIACGIGWWYYDEIAQHVEGSVREIEEQLSNKSFFIETMENIAKQWEGNPRFPMEAAQSDKLEDRRWTFNDLIRKLDGWIFDEFSALRDLEYKKQERRLNTRRQRARKMCGNVAKTERSFVRDYRFMRDTVGTGIRDALLWSIGDWWRDQQQRRVLQERTPLVRLAAKIGYEDFVRLLIARGLELGLITERHTRVDGRLRIEYSFQNPEPAL